LKTRRKHPHSATGHPSGWKAADEMDPLCLAM
jgi:hypothetical protein